MPDTTQSAGLIPDQLLSNIKKGDCVLFLGADLPLGYPGAPLSRPELAAALAERYGLPAGLSWPETVQAYLGRFPRDRHSVIRFVQEQCGGPQVQPGPLHQAVAGAGFRAIVTAGYDELLEQALREAGYRVNRVVRDTQLPYAEEGERSAIVVKLYGCLSDPESLVLDRWEHERLMDQLSRKLEVVTAFCTLRPPLFANFDLLQSTPIRFYVRASANLAEHMRRAYAVWPGELDAVQATWQGQNVEFCRGDAAAFLEALAGQAAIPGVGPGRRIRVHRPPYKFLDYYRAEDADIFCGRDTESQVVKRLILSHRLLTLFGPSGAGKTSLLLAGVLPQLAAEEYRHVYVRALDDPLPAMRKAIAVRAGRDDWQAGDRLADFLATMLAPKDRLIVVLDQFEELFLRVGSQKRARFFQELAGALDGSQREVRVVFSLREDYLAHLDEARPFMPDVLSNSFRLAALDRFNARIAVTEPAARAGVEVEPALVDALVGKAGETGGGDLVEESSGLVPPPALQIVLHRLYRGALPPGSRRERSAAARPDADPGGLPRHPPRAGAGRGERAGARAHRRRGHPGRLRGRGPGPAAGTDERGRHPAGGRRRTGRGDPQGDGDQPEDQGRADARRDRGGVGRGRRHRQDELARPGAGRSHPAGAGTRAAAARLPARRHGLLRADPRQPGRGDRRPHLGGGDAGQAGAGAVAPGHGRLAQQRPAAVAARGPGADQRAPGRAQEPERRRAGAAPPLQPGGRLRSALLVRARLPGATWRPTRIALEGLRSDSFRTRAAAVAALAQLGERFADNLIPMLADLYPQVRVAAIAALERLRPDGAWRQQLKCECYVPAGEFIMGDDKGDADEKPAHRVTLDAFYIGKYPVTNAEYARFIARPRPWLRHAGRQGGPSGGERLLVRCAGITPTGRACGC